MRERQEREVFWVTYEWRGGGYRHLRDCDTREEAEQLAATMRADGWGSVAVHSRGRGR